MAIIAAILLTPPGTPAGGFHWQRIITPPPGAGTQQACVVLDAATFANAAPALRDLRLFQDGTELPYVIEESYDERALNSGVTPDDDRSEYEAVLVLPLHMRQSGASFDGWHGSGPLPPPPGLFTGRAETELPPKVPVERLRLEPYVGFENVTVSALPPAAGAISEAEHVGGTIDQAHPALAITLGANLQNAANVEVNVGPFLEPHGIVPVQRVILEMRRRSLCYQPRAAAPLVLYLGGGQGIAAKVYGLSDGFSTDQQRPYATMGPLEPNPDLDHPAHHPISRLLVAIAILGTTLLLTLWIGLELLRKEKGRPKTDHS
ncbi:hypothetical protein [Terriglobus sp.]|uniref:hypothetical protein n=1 Tax=Terriglobus sp. TaxID=1889013 RepID=UPI003B0077EA